MEDFADDTPLKLTLREMHALAVSIQFWLVLAGVIAILSLSGPFGTYTAFSLPARAAFWTLVAAGSFGIGVMVSMLVTVRLEQAGLADPLALLCGGLTAGVPIAGLNALVQALFFDGSRAAGFTEVLPDVLIVSVLVAFLYERAGGQAAARSGEPKAAAATGAARAPQSDQPPGSQLVGKLPVALGGDVMHLQAQDHYLQVTTPRGSSLVLMSMKQAELDLQHMDGMRVHRSWWVRRCHVEGLTRHNGRLFVTLGGGQAIPVGRAYRNQVLAAFGKK